MRVFIRPTGAPLGQTIGFGPNGSSASLDTAEVVSSTQAGDLILVQRNGALVKTDVSALATSISLSQLTGLIQALGTVEPGGSGTLWLDGGLLALS